MSSYPPRYQNLLRSAFIWLFCSLLLSCCSHPKYQENCEKLQSDSVSLRYMEYSDKEYLNTWLKDPYTKKCFLASNDFEREKIISQWISYVPAKCGIVATQGGKPIGICTLYLSPFEKNAHHADFGIIVAPQNRGCGVGTLLLTAICDIAKNQLGLEKIHLQVHEDNPAYNLYIKQGFTEYGRQQKWIKEPNGNYVGRIFLEKKI